MTEIREQIQSILNDHSLSDEDIRQRILNRLVPVTITDNIRQNIIDTLISDRFLGRLHPSINIMDGDIQKIPRGEYTIICFDNDPFGTKMCYARGAKLQPLQAESLELIKAFPAMFISIDHAPRNSGDSELGYTEESLNIILETALHDKTGPPNPEDLDSDGMPQSTLPLTSQVTKTMHSLDEILLPSKLGTIDPSIDESKSGIVAFLTAPLAPGDKAQQGEKLTCHLRIVFTFPVTDILEGV